MKVFKKISSGKGTILLQIAENKLSAVKCVSERSSRRVFTALATSELHIGASDAMVASRVKEVFKKLGFNNDRVIISLASHQATHRYLKVPTQDPREIEQIVAFQAPKYLPYAAQELVTGFHIVHVDKEGYAHINLIIMPRDASQRYCTMLTTIGVRDYCITLGSYGLACLYHASESKDQNPILLVDVGEAQVELAIVRSKEVLLSRSFNPNSQKNFQDLLLDEIQKTNAAYEKETAAAPISQIGLFEEDGASSELAKALSAQINFQVKTIFYREKLGLSESFLASLKAEKTSFASLMGLAMCAIPESLNLLPKAQKETYRRSLRGQQRLRAVLVLSATILIFSLAVQKSIDNKEKYLNILRQHYAKIAKEAKPLEDLEKRLKLFYNRSEKKPSALDTLYELHRVVPAEVSLTNLSYEENGMITLRGQTQELVGVFSLVAAIENSAVFKNFNVKVRYATKKSTQPGAAMDFEIACSKEK